MATQIKKSKPTSPGRRFRSWVSRDDLHKGEPHAPLLEPKKQKSGRNNQGRITTRHRGGGHKKHYRIIDFKRLKDNIPAKVETLEYDPNRSANIALLLYADGERTYIIAPDGLELGSTILSGKESPISSGNCMSLQGYAIRYSGSLYRVISWKGGSDGTKCRSFSPNFSY